MASKVPASRADFHRKAGKRLSRADERECLAVAVQANAAAIVNSLNFNETDLPDQLISSGQITEDECSMIRKQLSKKDQIRYLISRTKGRDFKDIQKVLELFRKQIPKVVDMIYEQFESNKDKNIRCKTCALCQCVNVVDVKDVADNLWSRHAISDGLYNEIVASTRPRGSQSQLWRCVIDELNEQKNAIKRGLFDCLFDTILTRGSFEFLVRPMQSGLHHRKKLICECFQVNSASSLKKITGNPLSSSMPSSPASSRSSAGSETGSDDSLPETDWTDTEDDMRMGILSNNAPPGGYRIFMSNVKRPADNSSITPGMNNRETFSQILIRHLVQNRQQFSGVSPQCWNECQILAERNGPILLVKYQLWFNTSNDY